MKGSKLQIHYNQDSNVALKEATKSLNNYFKKFKGQPMLFLASGGSALKLLDGISESSLGNHTTIGVLDERYSSDPEINNFAQVAETSFSKHAKGLGCKFIDTRPKKGETQNQLAERFEKELKKWRKENPEGIILATIGIGPDGHTSGVLPFPENKTLFQKLFKGTHWVVAYDTKGKNPYSLRVTTTLTFLTLQINIALVYVAGVGKQEILKKALHENVDYSILPSMVLKEMKHVELFTDCKV